MKLVSTVFALLVSVSSIFASVQYVSEFDTFEGAVACLSKNVQYIKKVSGNVQVHGSELVAFATADECSDAIQQNFKDVCNVKQISCTSV